MARIWIGKEKGGGTPSEKKDKNQSVEEGTCLSSGSHCRTRWIVTTSSKPQSFPRKGMALVQPLALHIHLRVNKHLSQNADSSRPTPCMPNFVLFGWGQGTRYILVRTSAKDHRKQGMLVGLESSGPAGLS